MPDAAAASHRAPRPAPAGQPRLAHPRDRPEPCAGRATMRRVEHHGRRPRRPRRAGGEVRQRPERRHLPHRGGGRRLDRRPARRADPGRAARHLRPDDREPRDRALPRSGRRAAVAAAPAAVRTRAWSASRCRTGGCASTSSARPARPESCSQRIATVVRGTPPPTSSTATATSRCCATISPGSGSRSATWRRHAACTWPTRASWRRARMPAAPYEDCHAWMFTPASFALIILELGELGLAGLARGTHAAAALGGVHRRTCVAAARASPAPRRSRRRGLTCCASRCATSTRKRRRSSSGPNRSIRTGADRTAPRHRPAPRLSDTRAGCPASSARRPVRSCASRPAWRGCCWASRQQPPTEPDRR